MIEEETLRTVFIVDDEESIRVSLQRFLISHGYQTKVFSSATDFMEHPIHKGAGCMILDLQMPGMSGIELQQKLVNLGNTLPIVFLTAQGDIPTSVKAMKLGAEDFLPKMPDSDELLDAVERALHRSSKAIESDSQRKLARDNAASLTDRETEVCHCVIRGMLNKQIASRLGISERTVKAHRAKVMRKFAADSIPDLVRLTQAAGIKIEDDSI